MVPHHTVTLLFRLLIGHALADFSLQNEAMGKYKYKHRKPEPPEGVKPRPVWYYYLTAHALIHGGTVLLATNSPTLGILETATHWIIDYGKTIRLYNIGLDQTLHLLCKLLWVILLTQQV